MVVNRELICMKNLFLLFLSLMLMSCAQKTSRLEKKNIDQPKSPLAAKVNIPIQKSKESVASQLSPSSKGQLLFGKILSDVKVSANYFNPSKGDEVAIYYFLSKPAKITVKVYDPDGGLVRILENSKKYDPGKHSVIWDGRDVEGRIVPDEAYFFTIIAEDANGKREVYDPTTFSGGVEHDITSAEINPESGVITYKMPEMGRVMIRIGLKDGPLLNPLVDWKPRVKGMITEYWNGKDKDNLIDLYKNPRLKIIITYFTLPENSVIAYGNNALTYRSYKKTIAQNRPKKPERLRVQAVKLSPHYKLSRTIDYSPNIEMTFINVKRMLKSKVPVLSGKTIVKVDLAKEDRFNFENQQFEICFFLDNEFYAEDETGYTPFNWVWNLSDVTPGEHLLTVNISSFKDQVGVVTKKVYIEK